MTDQDVMSVYEELGDFLKGNDAYYYYNTDFVIRCINNLSEKVKKYGIEFTPEENTKFNQILNFQNLYSNGKREAMKCILSFPFVLDENVFYDKLSGLTFIESETETPIAIELTLQRNPKFFFYYFLKLRRDRDFRFVEWFINHYHVDFSEINYIANNKPDLDFGYGISKLFEIYGNAPSIKKYISVHRKLILREMINGKISVRLLDCEEFTTEERCNVIDQAKFPVLFVERFREIIELKCWKEIKDEFLYGRYNESSFSKGWTWLFEKELSAIEDSCDAIEDREIYVSECLNTILELNQEKSEDIKKLVTINSTDKSSLPYLVLRNIVRENTLRLYRLGLTS